MYMWAVEGSRLDHSATFLFLRINILHAALPFTVPSFQGSRGHVPLGAQSASVMSSEIRPKR